MKIPLVARADALEVALVNVGLSRDGEASAEAASALRIAMLRLAATRVCPVRRDDLAQIAKTSLRGLLPAADVEIEAIDADIDALIESGDLLRGAQETPDGRRVMVLYLAPPTYVRRPGGGVFLVGGFPEHDLPFAASARVRGALRELNPAPSDEELESAGLTSIPIDAWMEAPPRVEAPDLLARLEKKLREAGNVGVVDEVEVVDPDAPIGFYRGRWVSTSRRSGTFVCRRKKKWGGRAWGLAELVGGEVLKFVPFPAVDGRFRACDEAWWLMCAMDKLAGHPQAVEIESISTGRSLLRLRTPIPMWAERRMQLVGDLIEEPVAGSLFSWEIDSASVPAVTSFLEERLWMQVNLVGASA